MKVVMLYHSLRGERLKVHENLPYSFKLQHDGTSAKAFEQGLRTLTVEVKGPGSGRETAESL